SVYSSRQQRPGFDRETRASLLLKNAFPEHSLQEQARLRDCWSVVRSRLDGKLADRLEIANEAIVQNHLGDDVRVQPAVALNSKVPQLNFQDSRICDRRIRRDERTIRMRRRCADQGADQAHGSGCYLTKTHLGSRSGKAMRPM